MFNNEDKILNDIKKEYDNINIPESLDDYIKRGIVKGKKVSKHVWIKKIVTMAATFILICFVMAVRVSPAFAAYLLDVPGLCYIAQLINYDKGLQSALENDFIEPINISDEHEGITFTVDGIIVDESRMIVFYTLTKEDKLNCYIDRINFTDEKGEEIQAGYCYDGIIKDDWKQSKFHSKVDIGFQENAVIPDNIFINVKLRKVEESTEVEQPRSDKMVRVGELEPEPKERGKLINAIWKVKIPINKEKFQNLRQVYEINKIVQIENQKIEFKEAIIYPTRIGIKIEVDPQNTKKIFAFEDLEIVNEKGEKWERIKNGITGSYLENNTQVLYFQSNYFDNFKNLYLKGSSIRALDKDKLKVKVDLNEKKIVNHFDNKLIFDDMKKMNDKLMLKFLLKSNCEKDKNNHFSILNSKFEDAKGRSYSFHRQGCSTNFETGGEDKFIYLDANESYESPLTFTISDYPERINGKFEIKIK